MDLVGNVGNKLDTKLKSGDIKESEMIKEASEILDKMKNMPGMDNIQNLLVKWEECQVAFLVRIWVLQKEVENRR